jgi:hypothetical protein
MCIREECTTVLLSQYWWIAARSGCLNYNMFLTFLPSDTMSKLVRCQRPDWVMTGSSTFRTNNELRGMTGNEITPVIWLNHSGIFLLGPRYPRELPFPGTASTSGMPHIWSFKPSNLTHTFGQNQSFPDDCRTVKMQQLRTFKLV